MTQEDKDIIEETKQEKPKRMKKEKKEEKNLVEAEKNVEDRNVVKEKEEAIKKEDKKSEKKAGEEKKGTKAEAKHVVKKTEAVVRGDTLHISTKDAMALCRFVKGKTPEIAMAELERVKMKKLAVPMKGEIPHRKGKIMSGRYPYNASEVFIHLLKTLAANARVNGLAEDLPVKFAKANIASRPYGRYGRFRRKRTHVEMRIIAPKTEIKQEMKIGVKA